MSQAVSLCLINYWYVFYGLRTTVGQPAMQMGDCCLFPFVLNVSFFCGARWQIDQCMCRLLLVKLSVGGLVDYNLLKKSLLSDSLSSRLFLANTVKMPTLWLTSVRLCVCVCVCVCMQTCISTVFIFSTNKDIKQDVRFAFHQVTCAFFVVDQVIIHTMFNTSVTLLPTPLPPHTY